VQILILVWGVLAFIGMVLGLLPCLRALNWLTVPFAGIGIILAIAALISPKTRKEASPIAGLVCNVVAIVVGTLRLRGGASF
jgi:hypothetical protein